MSGHAHHAEMGAFLALLATRVPSVDELVGAASVMRAHVDPVECSVPNDQLLDTAGTGGTAKLFNVSTAAALVAAGAGVKVAKHGNRSRTGRGSAEVLAELGVNVDAARAVQRRCLEQAGICFCFAIHHHPAAKHAMPVRKTLGFPTIFNLLGPLTNPAGARRQLVGVYAPQFVRPVALALAELDSLRALVVHGHDGLDELSLSDSSSVAQVDAGVVKEFTITPEDVALARSPQRDLVVNSLADAADLVRRLLSSQEQGPPRSMLLLNAAAAIVAGGAADSLAQGVTLAKNSVDSGAAARALESLVRASTSAVL